MLHVPIVCDGGARTFYILANLVWRIKKLFGDERILWISLGLKIRPVTYKMFLIRSVRQIASIGCSLEIQLEPILVVLQKVP